MEPGEDCSSFVGQGYEWGRELGGEPVNRRDGFMRELGSMGVWA